MESAHPSSVCRLELEDPFFKNAFEKTKAYLKKLEVDRLVAGFRRTAGITTAAKTYGGWETSLIAGHTLGHYLKALAQAYHCSGDVELLDLSNATIAALSESQLDDGFLFATTGAFQGQLQFDNVEAGRTDIHTQAWVPWYTMHKILAGLVSTYQLCGLDSALACASRLGDWVYGRTSRWSKTTRDCVLQTEYGGMNDCLYELYRYTRKREHALAAHAFDEIPLFEAIHEGIDLLDGRHANTTIPKFLGALHRFSVWRDIGGDVFDAAPNEKGVSFYLESAERFWSMVVSSHTYITGGNSEDEHFGPPRVLDSRRSNVNCETCNTHNMLKLSKELHRLTGEKKYIDFYENGFINTILSSQNPETGMTMYFHPMATGYFKVFGSEFDHFWCCTGTGMENFTKLSDGLYSFAGDTLCANLYVSSTLDWPEKGVTLRQKSEIPDGEKVTFAVGGNAKFILRLRVPDWTSGLVELKLNQTKMTAAIVAGYVIVDRSWCNGDELEARFPMRIVATSLPDNPDVYAFTYGPVVLSAALGNAGMTTTTHGVNVLKPEIVGVADECISIDATYGSKEDWMAHLDENFERHDGRLEFSIKNTARTLVFSPHYRQYLQRYGIYWKILDAKGL